MSGASGRSGTGARRYRRNRDILLTLSDVCGICLHSGAKTADHIISDLDWPRGPDGRRVPGFDELPNLQPAHGSMGNTGECNYCPTCGLLCNQMKGARKLTPDPEPRSRRW